MSIGNTTRLALNLTRGFRDEPLGALELWLFGARYRLAVRKWRP